MPARHSPKKGMDTEMKDWTQIRVTGAVSDTEEIAAVMSMLDNNLMIEDPTDLSQMDTIYGELIDEELMKRDQTHAAVSMYVAQEENPAETAAILKDRFSELGLDCRVEMIGMNEADWTETWKKYYKPLKLSQHVTVVPAWDEEYFPGEDEKIIRMDPGMAFGSGTHETTRLCAMLLEKHMEKGAYVLDVGTGSGILAIAASRLGAGKVRCYDIDPVAVRVAGENIQANGCRNVVCGVSDLLKNVSLDEGQFDFVTANIVADILIRMSGDIGAYVRKDGLLAVSGVIDRQAEEVLHAMEKQGFALADELVENDWHAMLLRRL